MRLRLEYGDQNESFAKVLPVAGLVARKLRSKDGGEWILFQLDVPTTYEGIPYEYFLLRSRWLGMEIGDAKPTSVFILLVADHNEAQDGFDVHGFPHVAWGMAHVL
jgi:hypothetical protein